MHTGINYEKHLHLPQTRKIIIDAISEAIGPHRKEFDGFVIQGYSMSIIGSIIAQKFRKEIALVRKDSEQRNSHHKVEGSHNKKWVFLDDLISSEGTIKRCVEGVKDIGGTIVGICLWNGVRLADSYVYGNIRIKNYQVESIHVELDRLWYKLVELPRRKTVVKSL